MKSPKNTDFNQYSTYQQVYTTQRSLWFEYYVADLSVFSAGSPAQFFFFFEEFPNFDTLLFKISPRNPYRNLYKPKEQKEGFLMVLVRGGAIYI